MLLYGTLIYILIILVQVQRLKRHLVRLGWDKEMIFFLWEV